jgi:hypothetical protein
MTDDGLNGAVRRIADAGREDVVARLRDALSRQAAAAGIPLDPDELDRQATEAVVHADGVLWRRALAGAAVAELGLGLGEAVGHPAVLRAHAQVGAPPFPGDTAPAPAAGVAPAPAAGVAPAPAVDVAPAPAVDVAPAPAAAEPSAGTEASGAEADALRVAAVHLGGIEALRAGERDLELRISSAGLDVLKRSSGAPIGRLEWSEIQAVDLSRSRRGLRRGRRTYELHVATGRGKASFQLPGVTEAQLTDHLEPMLARARVRAQPGAGGL